MVTDMPFLILVGMFCLHPSANVSCSIPGGKNMSADSIFQILLKRIEDQDKKIAAIETNARSDRKDLERKIIFLEEIIKRSDSRQKILETAIDDLKMEIFELLNGNADTAKTRKMEEHGDTKQTMAISDRIKDHDTQNDMQIRQADVSGKPNQKRLLTGGISPTHVTAFYAYMSKRDDHPGQHQTIIFDTVITNVGGAYNHHDGIFTAPTNGVYVFTWNLYSSWGGSIVSELMVNSAQKGGRRSDSQKYQQDLSSSGTVVVQISQGDVVYVKTHPTFSIAGSIISYDTYQSSFSGWLLV